MPKTISVQRFIKENREAIDTHIRRVLGYPSATLSDDERRQSPTCDAKMTV